MDRILFTLLLLLMSTLLVSAKHKDSDVDNGEGKNRKSKAFPVFQVITFNNDACVGNSNNNGTCYTAAECTAKGGVSSGSTCASGYGVCCIFTLSCGGTTSQNCTYLVQASTTKAPTTNPCTYTICRCSTNICRIRLDFTTFQIAGPVTGTVQTVATNTAVTTTQGGGIGDCATDSFSISSPGNDGSPIICGYNTGQHMYVDASSACSVANFDIGSTSDTRQWNIKVTQYECGDSQGGPDGCLQYFTGNTGTISSFNFPTNSATVGASATHLSSQCYTICVRQGESKCSICYITAITNTAVPQVATAQTSFGLSVSNPTATTTASAAQDTSCTSDYLVIPNASNGAATSTSGSSNRICGRYFIATNTPQVGISVCSYVKPFTMTFKTDANENTGTAAAAGAVIAGGNELSDAPGGIVGFSLNYVQQSC